MRMVWGIFISVVVAWPVGAEPLVVGYERFHRDRPSPPGGALLYSELGCANCHGGSGGMVSRKGPSLENLSSRVSHDWVLGFLKDPEGGRKGSTMPAMLHGLNEEEVGSVMAYLSTLGKGLNFRPPRHANAEMGSALYHEKGCVACHAPGADYRGPSGSGLDLASPLAVPLPDLKKKTSLMALEHFLANTSRYRTDGRMPHLELGREGAINVAAYLLDLQGTDPREEKKLTSWPKPKGDQINLGRRLVEAASCASCHDFPGIEPPGMIRLTGGGGTAKASCLSTQPARGLPRYGLSSGQRDALRAYLADPARVDDEAGVLTLQAMNCYACHERDGLGGPTPETRLFFHGEESLGDSGKLPPPLTGIGHKLRQDWLEGVIAGDSDKRVRSYLKTVMPAYPGQARVLASSLAKIDAQPEAKPMVKVAEAREAGRKLLGTLGGNNCITCHHWGEKRSLGIPALDLSSLNQRLRPEWFRSYLLAPAAYRPGTLMPSLWPEGRSNLPEILGGDSEKQIAAIWSFIEHGEGIPEGFPDRSSGEYELRPTTRPIIQRTFFEGVGTKAILVGFPGEISLAFDGDKARPVMIWRGAFFDAYHTWFTRAAPFEKPLGNEVSLIPEASGERRFRGYELDDAGVPTFLYHEAGRLVRERYEVVNGELHRVITWQEGKSPAYRHPAGVVVAEARKEKEIAITYRWK